VPRRSHQLAAADYALLGLLMLGPRHGYELAPYFANNGTLGLVCTLGVSRLYAILHALEELGLVHAETSVISGGPPRKVFSLTEAGRAAFEAWLDQPIRRLRQIRQDFVLKLYFSRQLPGDGTAALMERQIAVSRAVADELAAQVAAEGPDSFAALVYGSRLATARATIVWLEEERDRAAPAPASPAPDPAD
jgi:PadR family transcriptional regulator, regulatory protein AphA